MGYEFLDYDGKWKPTASDDPVYTYGLSDSGLGEAGWTWNGKNLEGQQYRKTSDDSGIEVEGTPDWMSAYSEKVANYGSNVIDQFGTSFLDSLQSSLDKLSSAGPYEDETAQAVTDLLSAYDNLSNADDWIETERKAMGQEFLSGLGDMNQYYQPTLNSLASRGILNSSVTGDSLAKIQNNINTQYSRALNSADQWAAEQQLSLIENMPTWTESLISTLNSLDQYDMQRLAAAGSLAGAGQSLVDSIASMGLSGVSGGLSTYNADLNTALSYLLALLGSSSRS